MRKLIKGMYNMYNIRFQKSKEKKRNVMIYFAN